MGLDDAGRNPRCRPLMNGAVFGAAKLVRLARLQCGAAGGGTVASAVMTTAPDDTPARWRRDHDRAAVVVGCGESEDGVAGSNSSPWLRLPFKLFANVRKRGTVQHKQRVNGSHIRQWNVDYPRSL